jgi:HK97 family phage portal protein
MATNPFRAIRDFLAGDDLKAQLTTTTPEPAPELKQITYTFTTDVYDSATVGPTLSAAFGGHQWDGNSAVFACLSVICNASMEAPLRTFRKARDGAEKWLDDHAFQVLVDDPHPSLTQPEMTFWVQWAKRVAGNAYLRKIRSASNGVVQLWPISPTKLWPVTTKTDAARGIFISHYTLDLGDGKTEDIPVEDILHFRMGIDDRDHRLGMSPLQRLLREIATDEEATRFSDALLKNFAIPGLAVSIPPGPTITEEQARTIRDRLRTEYGGQGRGQIAVIANGATMQQFGFSPQQLDLKGLHRLPEERISAVFGVAAMVVGLGAGLDRSTFSNYEEAREALFEQSVLPTYRADAATYQKHLLRPDFATDKAIRCKYDISDVRSLQPDMNEVYARLSLAIEKGWVKRNEARSEVGLPPVDGWDEEDEAPAPEPMAPQGALPDSQQPGQPQRALPPPPKARQTAEQKAQALGAIPGLLDVVHDLTAPVMERDLAAYLTGQRQRVMGRLKRGA